MDYLSLGCSLRPQVRPQPVVEQAAAAFSYLCDGLRQCHLLMLRGGQPYADRLKDDVVQDLWTKLE